MDPAASGLPPVIISANFLFFGFVCLSAVDVTVGASSEFLVAGLVAVLTGLYSLMYPVILALRLSGDFSSAIPASLNFLKTKSKFSCSP